MNGTFNYNNKVHYVYKDTYVDLEFIFVEGQEKLFRDLQEEYGSVSEIPEEILLTGMYFNKGTRNLSPEFENSHIRARYITK